MKERRRSKRKREGNKVTIEPISSHKSPSGKKISIAFTDDMSMYGFKIISDAFFPVDSLLKIDISLAKAKKIIIVTGKVRWIESLGDETYEVGIEIVDTTKENVLIFYEHLYANNSEI